MGNGLQGTDYEAACIEALKLKLAGWTFTAIGEEQGCSHSTAFRRVSHALEQMRPHADYDEYRARQLAEIEHIRNDMYAVATTSMDSKIRFAAIDRILKLHEREAKLLNLDQAPTPLEDAARELAKASDEDINEELARRTHLEVVD